MTNYFSELLKDASFERAVLDRLNELEQFMSDYSGKPINGCFIVTNGDEQAFITSLELEDNLIIVEKAVNQINDYINIANNL